MEESNLRECKICKQLKQRIAAGKFDDKNKRYNDENGKAWMGNTCSSCHKEEIRKRMKAMRAIRKSLA